MHAAYSVIAIYNHDHKLKLKLKLCVYVFVFYQFWILMQKCLERQKTIIIIIMSLYRILFKIDTQNGQFYRHMILKSNINGYRNREQQIATCVSVKHIKKKLLNNNNNKKLFSFFASCIWLKHGLKAFSLQKKKYKI